MGEGGERTILYAVALCIQNKACIRNIHANAIGRFVYYKNNTGP